MSQTNGYGTTAQGAPAAITNHVDEEQPLLANGDASRNPKNSFVARVRKAARAEIKRDWTDVVLIFCYIITGLLDSASISIWGSFVSMQTGTYRPLFFGPNDALLSIQQADRSNSQATPSTSAWASLPPPNLPVGSNPAPR